MKRRKLFSMAAVVISVVMLLSGCSIIPEVPDKETVFYSKSGTFQLKAPNHWIELKNNEEGAEIALISRKLGGDLLITKSDHVVYTAFNYDSYCNMIIKKTICEKLDFPYPDEYSEEVVMGKKARWYQGYYTEARGENDSYYCLITEYGEQETEKEYLVVLGFFLDKISDEAKDELLNIIDSIEPINFDDESK